MSTTIPLTDAEISQRVDTTASAVAADFDAQYASDAQITALHTYLTTTKSHELSLADTRRFLTVLRGYILGQTRTTEEHLLKEKGVSGLDANGIPAAEVRGMVSRPALLRLMVIREFNGEGGMVAKAGQLEADIAQWRGMEAADGE